MPFSMGVRCTDKVFLPTPKASNEFHSDWSDFSLYTEAGAEWEVNTFCPQKCLGVMVSSLWFKELKTHKARGVGTDPLLLPTSEPAVSTPSPTHFPGATSSQVFPTVRRPPWPNSTGWISQTGNNLCWSTHFLHSLSKLDGWSLPSLLSQDPDVLFLSSTQRTSFPGSLGKHWIPSPLAHVC